MHYSIDLEETVKVSDSASVVTEIDAIIYRLEFEKYRETYLKSKLDHELIFCFIFLQIYIECFLHQNMRRVTEMEFKSPRDEIATSWFEGEKRKIPTKVDSFTTNFFPVVSTDVAQFTTLIKERFQNIADIRNRLVHGHKIATWFDSDGDSGISEARSFLTENRLNQSIAEVNELGLAWNDLLRRALPQCKALRRVDDFMFSNIRI